MVNNLDLASIFWNFWPIFDPKFRFFWTSKIFRTKTGFLKNFFWKIQKITIFEKLSPLIYTYNFEIFVIFWAIFWPIFDHFSEKSKNSKKIFRIKKGLTKKFPKKHQKKWFFGKVIFRYFFAFCMVNNLDLASIFGRFFGFLGFLADFWPFFGKSKNSKKIFRIKKGFTKNSQKIPKKVIFRKIVIFRYFFAFSW